MYEIWKDIPGYEGKYQVSNLGRVKSLPRVQEQMSKGKNYHTHKIPGKILKPRKKKCGHMQVHICGKNEAVHKLVMLTFVGERPTGVEICHNDSNPANNSLDNLRYDTREANRVDMIFAGNQARQKLSVCDVKTIRNLLADGSGIQSIADRYGVSYSTIWNIKKGETFKCVE